MLKTTENVFEYGPPLIIISLIWLWEHIQLRKEYIIGMAFMLLNVLNIWQYVWDSPNGLFLAIPIMILQQIIKTYFISFLYGNIHEDCTAQMIALPVAVQVIIVKSTTFIDPKSLASHEM